MDAPEIAAEDEGADRSSTEAPGDHPRHREGQQRLRRSLPGSEKEDDKKVCVRYTRGGGEILVFFH